MKYILVIQEVCQLSLLQTTNIWLMLSNHPSMSLINVSGKIEIRIVKDMVENMDYLRMDGKRGHVTCGNRLAIERQESFQKFASLEKELLLPSAQACWDPARSRMA